MDFLKPKLIIYDGSCGLCIALKERVLNFEWFPEEKIVAFQDLQPELRRQVDPSRFKNEMALIDLNGENTLYGADGIAFLFKEKWNWIKGVFTLPGTFPLFKVLYKTLAFNRFAISTPNFNLIRCTGCEPEIPLGYRLGFYALCLTLATAVTMAFGASLSVFFPDISHAEGAGWMMLMAGSGWVFQGLFALLGIPLGKKLDYLAHLGTTMVIGVAILIPSTLWLLLGGPAHWTIPAISVLASSMVMLYQHIKRERFMEIHQAWTASWFLSLQFTAAIALILFCTFAIPDLNRWIEMF